MSDNKAFWTRCADESLAIVPIWDYPAMDERDGYLGTPKLRFVALWCGDSHQSSGSFFWVDVDDGTSDVAMIGDTPEEAIELFLQKRRSTG